MPNNEFEYSPVPGLVLSIVGHPTELDPKGCDGLYVEAVFITDLNKFDLFLHWTSRQFYSFSLN